MFAYCLNNPVIMRDKTGNVGWVVGAIAGAIVGGLAAAFKGDSIVSGAVSGAIAGGFVGAICDSLTGNPVGMAIAVGGASMLGEYVNQVGNNIADGESGGNVYKPNDWGELIEAGVVGTLLAPLSIGGSRLTAGAFGAIKSGVNKVAKDIVDFMIATTAGVIQEVTRTVVQS